MSPILFLKQISLLFKKHRATLFYIFTSFVLLVILINQIKSCNKINQPTEVVINSNDNLYNYQKSLLNKKILVLNKQLDSLKQKKDSIRIKYIPLYIAVSNKEDKRDEILYEHGVLDDTFVDIEDHNQLIDFRLVQGLEARANIKLCNIQNRILASVIEEYQINSATDSVYIQSILGDLKGCVIQKEQFSTDLAVSKDIIAKEKKKSKTKNWAILGLSAILTSILIF